MYARLAYVGASGRVRQRREPAARPRASVTGVGLCPRPGNLKSGQRARTSGHPATKRWKPLYAFSGDWPVMAV